MYVVKFLTDQYPTLKSNLRIGITNLLSNITTKEDSHKGGWAKLLKCQLNNLHLNNVTILTNKDSLNDFDWIIFDLGAEYSGALNLFGGLDSKVLKRLQEIKDYNGQLLSWKSTPPDVTTLNSRRNNASTCEEFKQTQPDFLSKVQEKLNKTITFTHAYHTSCLLVGDSHTPGIWDPSYMIDRRDGQTLHGFIKNDLLKEAIEYIGVQVKEVAVHASSIDIRHHLCRQENPVESTSLLVSKLLEKLTLEYHPDGPEKFTLIETMGIEDESRELPKTGYYKGTSYYGDWTARAWLRLAFNKMLHKAEDSIQDLKVIKYPEYFFDESGKLRFDVMEKPGSVHISPQHYRWDLDNNKLRWTENQNIEMKTKYATLSLTGQIERNMYESQ